MHAKSTTPTGMSQVTHDTRSPPPAARGHLLTEQSLPASANIDTMSVDQILACINDQDAIVPGVVRRAIPAITRLVDDVVNAMSGGGRLIYLGAGTSGRLGVLDAAECPPTFHCDPADVVGIIAGGDQSLRRSSEGAEDNRTAASEQLEQLDVGQHDVVVGIAAGGTTPFVLGALDQAHDRGAITAMICCARDQQTAQVAIDHVIEIPVGPEVVTGSTRMKAGTATKLVLNMISTATMVRLGKTWGNLMVDLCATNDKLRDRAGRMLQTYCELSRDDALNLLDRADGHVKVAMVMHHRAVDAGTAQGLLDEHGGRLGNVITGAAVNAHLYSQSSSRLPSGS